MLEIVYANGSSAKSETQITVNSDIWTNPPRDLTAVKVDDTTAELNWFAPVFADSERLRYDNGTPAPGTAKAR